MIGIVDVEEILCEELSPKRDRGKRDATYYTITGFSTTKLTIFSQLTKLAFCFFAVVLHYFSQHRQERAVKRQIRVRIPFQFLNLFIHYQYQ